MNKRGISPLIATILIIGLVVVIAVLVNSFIFDVTEEEINRVGEESKVLSNLLNYDVSCRNAHDRSYVRLSSSSDSDIDFAVQFDGEVASGNTIEGFGSGSVVGSESKFVKVIPSIEVDGQMKVLASQALEENCNDESGNYALEFDGADDYVDFGALDVFSSGEFSISVWINSDINTENRLIVGKNEIGGQREFLFYQNGIEIRMLILDSCWGSGDPAQAQTSGADIGVEKWYNLVTTVENNLVKVYVDGVELAQAPFLGTYCSGGEDPFVAGKLLDEKYWWDGKLDEIRIWNRPLNEGEVESLYKNNKVPPGLVAYWNFDNNVEDSVGENDGTNHGAEFVPAN